MGKTEACIHSYRRLKNLKLVGEELGIPWQTVYVHLRNANEPVTGDKLRYGSDKDRMAARAEVEFLRLVPFAEDQNRASFQSKVDFNVKGYGVDVKSSTKRNDRWAFSLKKQELIADFFACFAYADDGSYLLLLIPGDVCRKYQSVSLSARTRTKWWDYSIESAELAPFFRSLTIRKAA
jgi:hypothetical protein